MHYFQGQPIVSDQITPQELKVIMREFTRVLNAGVPGDVVELGCYEGTTALFTQRELQARAEQRILHVYDSFAGLPVKHIYDTSPAGEQFKAGELLASKARLIRHFKHAGLPLPVIHKGWFSDFTVTDMPKVICFAFLDGDFYQSIIDSLRLVWPQLAPGATVIIDDYHIEALPGVAKAVKEWSQNHSFTLKTEASLAIITR